MTKPELLREIGIHLKKVVDIYNQLAKNPEAFTPGEIDMMVNNATKIIEYAAVVKHQPASSSNTDEQIRLRDLEDKLRVASEQLKSKDFEIEKLQRTKQELEKKVEENKHLADAFSVDIPEVSDKIDSNSTLAKTDLLNSSLITEIPIVERKVTPVEKIETFTSPSFFTENKVDTSTNAHDDKKKIETVPTSFASKYETDNDGGSKKTVMSSLNESIIDGSKENVAEKMMKTQVTDLSKVIPLHEKFHITNELFGKNNEHYTQFVDAMNGKQTWKEAEQLLAQAASMYKWDPENKTALNFIALIQRRFN